MPTLFDLNYFSHTFSLYCTLLDQAIRQGNETEMSRNYEAMGKLLLLAEEFLTDDEWYLFITTIRRACDLDRDLDRDLIAQLKGCYIGSLIQETMR